jgi:hypothetical protein
MSDDDISFGPNDLPLYEALVRRLEASGNFRRAERATRLMLHALGGKNRPVEHGLWRRLVALHRDRLDDRTSAIIVARQLVGMWPGDFDDALALARLYAADGQREKADGHYLAALAIAQKPEVLRELVSLRLACEETAGAWAATSVLASIDDLADDERALFEARTPRDLPTGRLDRKAWADFAPPEALAEILGCLAAPTFEAARERPVSPAVWDRRFLPAQLGTPQFRAAFACAVQALGLPAQSHFADPEPTASYPPLEAPMDDATRELLFVAGRQAALHRPEHLVLFHHCSIAELTALVWSAYAATEPAAPVPAHLRDFVTNIALQFRSTMTADALAAMTRAVRRFTAWDSLERSLPLFRDLADCHAARAGLLLCGDLRLARRALAAEPPSFGALPLDEKMKDLRSFALSPRYVALRDRLGFRPKLVVH